MNFIAESEIKTKTVKYNIRQEKKTYSQANAYCKNNGGKLFEPKSASINNRVVALARSKGVTLFWIGINDKTTEGRFTYESDGKVIVWKNWNSGEPNNGRSGGVFGWSWSANEDCVESIRGKWNDKNCNERRSFVCEM